MKLSLVMPVHNEAATLPVVLKRLGEVPFELPWELILVDDGSTDGAPEAVDWRTVGEADRTVLVRSRRNQGKGAALRKGFSLAEGDILGVQDADLEYDPMQIPSLIRPIVEGRTEVVFGSREFSAHSSYSFWHVIGNRAISLATGAIFNRYVSDVYTCYKFFTRDWYEKLTLNSVGFDIEAELTGELLRHGARVFELPITYVARTRAEGKKIRASAGVSGFARLLEVRLRSLSG